MPDFWVLGVDRDSGLDTRLRVSANTEQNARVKADMRGMVVTGVEAQPPTSRETSRYAFCNQCRSRTPNAASCKWCGAALTIATVTARPRRHWGGASICMGVAALVTWTLSAFALLSAGSGHRLAMEAAKQGNVIVLENRLFTTGDLEGGASIWAVAFVFGCVVSLVFTAVAFALRTKD